MVSSMLAVELACRGAAAGVLLVTGFSFLREGINRSLRVSGALFTLAITSYALVSSEVLAQALGPLRPLAMCAALGGVGYCWLFVVTLFEDQPVSPASLSPAILLTLVGLVALSLSTEPRRAVLVLHNLLEIALALHALAVIQRSWRGDLVEARRRLRAPLMSLVAVYAILVSGVEIGLAPGVDAAWRDLGGAVALAALSMGGGATFLAARASLFGAADPRNPPESIEPGLDAADHITLQLLEDAMRTREVWRQERLSIGDLAEEVRVPEHTLRRLINGHLGHRNFAAYVNAHRIEAAKRILSDPAHSRTAVAPIAFELGFGSLGPFNRAFREATGQSPTAWRAAALEKTLKNP